MVYRCGRNDIKSFIEKWHYSKSINGCTSDYCYQISSPDNVMVGALFYGMMSMAGQWKRFSSIPDNVIELRRLCCIDNTPANIESFFVSRTLKMLRKDWRSDGIVVSYSDMEYGHIGTIYKASNFKCLGESRGAKVIMWNGKKYHDKSVRAKYNGKIKPFAEKLRDALKSGDAKYVSTKGKITFIYNLQPNNNKEVGHATR
jgi:hypothetical protein